MDQETLVFRRWFFTWFIVTYAYISLFYPLQHALRHLQCNGMLPYQYILRSIASVVCLCPFIFRAKSLDQ